MSNVIELDPTFVFAYPQADVSSGISSGAVVAHPPQTPYMVFIESHVVRKVYANGQNMFPIAQQGDVEGAMQAFFSGLNGLPAAEVKKQLQMHADAQKWLLNMQVISPSSVATSYAVIAPRNTEQLYGTSYFKRQDFANTPQHYDFFGTALMPIAGIYYWLFGDGQTRYVNIGALNLSMVPSDFAPIMNAVSANGPGTYAINQPFQYNAFRFAINLWAAGLLGRVSGNVAGNLTIGGDGSWSFDGGFTLNPDKYDADHSNRTYMQEKLTNFLRYLGDTFGNKDYQIVIEGSQRIQLSGHK